MNPKREPQESIPLVKLGEEFTKVKILIQKQTLKQINKQTNTKTIVNRL